MRRNVFQRNSKFYVLYDKPVILKGSNKTIFIQYPVNMPVQNSYIHDDFA